MKAAVFRGVQNVQIEEVETPQAGAGDVVVAVRQCGICGSDLHTYLHGSFVEPGQVMGHEFVGEVVATGSDVEGVNVGDRVTASPLVPCGECPRCHEGRFNLCAKAWTQGIAYGRPGAFADMVRIPQAVPGQNLFPLSEDVSDDAVAAWRRARPCPGHAPARTRRRTRASRRRRHRQARRGRRRTRRHRGRAGSRPVAPTWTRT